jgi:hypothetical protein
VRREQRNNLLRAIVNQVRKQEYPYEPMEKKEIDWSAYDRAQINEVNDMLCLIRDTVDAAWRRLQPVLERDKGPGLPPIPVPDLAKAVLVQQYFGVSNRETEGLMLLFEEKLSLTRGPTVTATSRGSSTSCSGSPRSPCSTSRRRRRSTARACPPRRR